MEVVLDGIVQYVTELIVIIVGALLSVVLHKVRTYVDTLKKKDEMHIVDLITDVIVEYTEVELRGSEGIVKRNFAIDKAIKSLEAKGIKVDREDVIAGIEQGVSKMNNKKK